MEFRTMSLRECAIHDVQKYGENAVKDLKEKQRRRKLSKRKGIKTNVGDPIHNRKTGK